MLNMLVCNIYTYESLGFDITIYCIYNVLVHKLSLGMLKSIIFLPLDTNIDIIFYFSVCILFEEYYILL